MPTASTSPSAAATSPEAVWEFVEFAFGTFESVAADGQRVVVVAGLSPCPGIDAHCHGNIWTSAVGGVLEPVPDAPSLDVGSLHPIYGPAPGFHDVAAGPGGFVVLGFTGLRGQIEPALWHSVDGLAWEAVDTAQLFGGARLEAILAGGPGYIVVGAIHGPQAPRAAVWTSPDGLTWSIVPDQAAFEIGGYVFLPEGPPSAGGMTDAAVRDGEIVAVGSWCLGGVIGPSTPTLCRPAIWHSEDAQTWTQVDPTAGEEIGTVASIAADDERFVAAGKVGFDPSMGVTLTSTDGNTWHSAVHDPIPGFDRISAVRGGFIAYTGLYSDRLRVWISLDGVDWRELGGVPQVEGAIVLRELDAAVAGDSLVIVGWVETRGGPGLVGFVITGDIGLMAP